MPSPKRTAVHANFFAISVGKSWNKSTLNRHMERRQQKKVIVYNVIVWIASDWCLLMPRTRNDPRPAGYPGYPACKIIITHIYSKLTNLHLIDATENTEI